MKMFWLFSPFLLLDRIGSVFAAPSSGPTPSPSLSATPYSVTDMTSLVVALDGANTIVVNPENSEFEFNDTSVPTTIEVALDAWIDFDGNNGTDPNGLALNSKFLDVVCLGYNETHKCTFERSANGGRFFRTEAPYVNVSFTGFEFIGGSTPNDQDDTGDDENGGAFAFLRRGFIAEYGPFGVTFTDCSFVSNTAAEKGGAVFMVTYDEVSSLTFTGCTFKSNTGSKGGAICVETWDRAIVDLFITQSIFSRSSNGVDIQGSRRGQRLSSTILFACNDTATTRGRESVNLPDQSAYCTGGWERITNDGFENGWGNFEKKEDSNKADRVWHSGADFIPSGNAALVIRNGKGKKSSVWHDAEHDVTGFANLRVTFSFCAKSMDGGDTFVLEYSSSGKSGRWIEIKEFEKGANKDFENDECYYDEIVDFNQDYKDKDSENDYDLDTTKAMIRFKCKGDNDSDRIYIDDVKFEGYLAN